MSDEVTARDKLHDAMATVIRDEEAAMLSKWVTIMEVIDEHGDRTLWSMTSEGLAMWDRIGMIEFSSRMAQPELPPTEDDDER